MILINFNLALEEKYTNNGCLESKRHNNRAEVNSRAQGTAPCLCFCVYMCGFVRLVSRQVKKKKLFWNFPKPLIVTHVSLRPVSRGEVTEETMFEFLPAAHFSFLTSLFHVENCVLRANVYRSDEQLDALIQCFREGIDSCFLLYRKAE